MTDDEILAVVQAHKEGKQIQFRNIEWEYDKWSDMLPTHLGWNFRSLEYRVKPEPRKPREWMVGVSPDKQIRSWKPPYSESDWEIIRVREVLDD